MATEANNRKILFVASLGRDHIIKFHIPTIRAFKKAGWIVDVACAGEEKIPEVRYRYTMSWQRSPFNLGLIKGIRELEEILAEEHYDVVYCHTPVGGVAGRLAARKARKNGTKVVYCVHGLHFYKGAPLRNWLVYYPVEKWLARMTDAIFTINQEDYETVKKRFRKGLSVYLLPGIGVEFDRLRVDDPETVRKQYREELDIPQDACVMIYAADIVANKNQKMLIDVLKELRGQGLNVYLLLPGPESDGGAFRRYAKSQGVYEYCRFLGWRSDIGELMYASDVCTASSIREGFGLSLVEAMYCGLPVVATDNRGHRSIIRDGENGVLVKMNDSRMMAECVVRILEEDEFRKQLSNHDMEKYDCRKVAAVLQKCIEKIAGRE